MHCFLLRQSEKENCCVFIYLCILSVIQQGAQYSIQHFTVTQLHRHPSSSAIFPEKLLCLSVISDASAMITDNKIVKWKREREFQKQGNKRLAFSAHFWHHYILPLTSNVFTCMWPHFTYSYSSSPLRLEKMLSCPIRSIAKPNCWPPCK